MSSNVISTESCYKELALAMQNGATLYTGNNEGTDVKYYFHLDNQKFTYDTQVEGKFVQLIGDLKRPEDEPNNVLCVPKWIYDSELEDALFVEAEGEETMMFDLSKKIIDLREFEITLVGESPDLNKIKSLEEEEGL